MMSRGLRSSSSSSSFTGGVLSSSLRGIDDSVDDLVTLNSHSSWNEHNVTTRNNYSRHDDTQQEMKQEFSQLTYVNKNYLEDNNILNIN